MNALLRIFFVGQLFGAFKFVWYFIITILILILQVLKDTKGDSFLQTMAIGFGISLVCLLMQIIFMRKEKSALKEAERLLNERNFDLFN